MAERCEVCHEPATVHRFGETWLCEEHNRLEEVRLNLQDAEAAPFYLDHFGKLAAHVGCITLINALRSARREVNDEISRLRAENRERSA